MSENIFKIISGYLRKEDDWGSGGAAAAGNAGEEAPDEAAEEHEDVSVEHHLLVVPRADDHFVRVRGHGLECFLQH